MKAIRIKQKLDSETLHLPQVRPLLGKQVEIIALEDEPAPNVAAGANPFPLRGSILRDDDPFAPAVPADDWDFNA